MGDVNQQQTGQTFVRVAAGLLVCSTAFPVAASLDLAEPSRWVGVLDVAVAFILVAAGIGINARAPSAFDPWVIAAAFRIYRHGATLFLMLLVAFFLAGDRITWSILLPGLAWRGWLAVWVLPCALMLWRQGRMAPGSRYPTRPVSGQESR